MQPNRPGGELEVIQRFVDEVRPGTGDEWLKPIGVGEQVLASSYDGDAFGPLPPQFSRQAIEDWQRAVRIIIQSGWRMHIHATRNHSAEQLLPALEEINGTIPLAPRRIVFAHMEDVTPATARRILAIGAGITVQDRLVFSGGDIMENWPADVYRQAPPVRMLLSTGVPVGGGTDSTRVAPYNPFISLWWLVTGKMVDGVVVRGAAASPSRL
jgi:predicted amidohydrolase YtcJ